MKHTIAVLTIVFTLFIANGLNAQVIAPTAVTEEKATQLVFWTQDDDFASETSIRVINTSSTESVTLHVQLWVSDDGGGDPTDPEDVCLETNFTDTFTPNDVHIYDMDDVYSNTDICLTDDSGPDPLDCSDDNEIIDLPGGADDTGFVTITPVVSLTDLRAIAFNHMIGVVDYVDDGCEECEAARVNAFGRQARSHIDGSLLADGTILDGVTGGLVLIQPEVLKFNFNRFDADDDSDIMDAAIVTFMFNDDYSFFGGYSSQPSSATFSPLIFNDTEVPVSCQDFTPTCIINQGVNNDLFATNTDPADDMEVDDDSDFVICRDNTTDLGWMRLAVTLPDATTNVFGVTGFSTDSDDLQFARVMAVEGDDVVPTPTPTPTPSVTPTPSGGAASPTPTGGGQPGGGGGGGSGCAIAGPVQAGTALANMLIVLLPGAAFALRRRFTK